MQNLREVVTISSIIIAFSLIYRQFAIDLEFQLMPNSESFMFMYLFKGNVFNVLSYIFLEYGKYILIFPVIICLTNDNKLFDYIISSKNDIIEILKMSVFIIAGSVILSEGIFEMINSSIDFFKSRVSFFSYFDKDLLFISILKIVTGGVLITFQKRYLKYKEFKNIDIKNLMSNCFPASWLILILLSSTLVIAFCNFLINLYRNSFNFNISSKDIIPLIITLSIIVFIKFKDSNYYIFTNIHLKFIFPFLCCSYLYFIKFSVATYQTIRFSNNGFSNNGFNFSIIYASVSIALLLIYVILSHKTKNLIKNKIV